MNLATLVIKDNKGFIYKISKYKFLKFTAPSRQGSWGTVYLKREFFN